MALKKYPDSYETCGHCHRCGFPLTYQGDGESCTNKACRAKFIAGDHDGSRGGGFAQCREAVKLNLMRQMITAKKELKIPISRTEIPGVERKS